MRAAVLGIVFLVLPFIPPFDRQDLLQWLVIGLLLAGEAIAFDFSAGYISVVNFGIAGFVGIGGYTMGLLAVHLGVSPWIGLIVALPTAALAGAVTGLFTLRFRGLYTSVAAWFLAFALEGLVINLQKITGGSVGLGVPRFFEGNSFFPYYYLALFLVIVSFVVLRLIVDSSIGLAFRALGDNIDAARASGITPRTYRVFNFAVSCGVAGVFGAFYGGFYGVLTPQLLDVAMTVPVLVVVYVAGRGTLLGPALFAIPFTFFNQWLATSLTNLPGLGPFVYGLFLILVVLLYPGGLTALGRAVLAWIRARRTADGDGGGPSLVRSLERADRVAAAPGDPSVSSLDRGAVPENVGAG
jgi:branched-chain amino acid transport system permease protein